MGNIRIGILGVTKISIRSIINIIGQRKDVEIYGVAARDISRAKEFAKVYRINHVFDDYKSLVESGNIDIVYIPLATHLHAKWTIEAVKYGKAVLVEKPLCISKKEADEIEKAIADNNGFVKEALMVNYHPFQKDLKRIIGQGKFGRIISTKSYVCYPFPEDDRNAFANKCGGAFLHESAYWLQVVQEFIGLAPVEIDVRSEYLKQGYIDLKSHVKLTYEDGTLSEFTASLIDPVKFCHQIDFQNYTIKIDNLFKPTLGKLKLKMLLINKLTNEINQVNYEPENYYLNQLGQFISDWKNKDCKNSLAKSFERIELMEKINNIIVHNSSR
jgi:dTDP-3,4-didehydro-2,6-dideoxy-alpha-D-glucose 3-reductase